MLALSRLIDHYGAGRVERSSMRVQLRRIFSTHRRRPLDVYNVRQRRSVQLDYEFLRGVLKGNLQSYPWAEHTLRGVHARLHQRHARLRDLYDLLGGHLGLG